MDKETLFEYIQRLKLAVITLFKWLFCSFVCGCFIGSVGAVFHLMLGYVGSLRVEYPFYYSDCLLQVSSLYSCTTLFTKQETAELTLS